jgi:quercetin dioxygenase-like cupin family protein
MKYTRLYADQNGDSHFEDLEASLSPREFASSSPPLNLSELQPATEFGFMSAPEGWTSDWHPSSGRNFFVVFTGEWEVTAGDGETRHFTAGSALLVEDTIGKGHTSRVISESISLLVQLPPEMTI